MSNLQHTVDANGNLRVVLILSADELRTAGLVPGAGDANANAEGSETPTQAGSTGAATSPEPAASGATAAQPDAETPAASPPPTPFGTPPAPGDAPEPQRPMPDPTDLSGRGPQPDVG